MKICSKCKTPKELNDFNKSNKSKCGYRSECNLCRKLYYDKNKENVIENNKNWVKNNPEKVKQQKINYRVSNKDKINEDNENYRKLNFDKIKLYQNEYTKKSENKLKRRIYKKQKLKDPLYKLKHNIGVAIRESFRKNGYTKKSRSYEILGCTYDEFKQYIENKFKDWMNWENHGIYNGKLDYGWDIDHIEPLNNAKCEVDIIRLNHYTNLQPLCSYTNRTIKRGVWRNNLSNKSS